ncbi:MAG: alanine dehydrogenase [Cellvibrionaceae bacterium]|nr:alanine dehydrogenase [Cellvibrionaceae bacterium]
MIIGVPKEIKNHEYRVGLTPASVRELTLEGHSVLLEASAGNGVGFDDALYIAAGAQIVASADQVFAEAEMIVKVKEPQPDECRKLRSGQFLYTYLHLAPDPEQARLLLDSGAHCIAYETVTDSHGGLPLLAPMSEVAGRLSIQAGAHHLEKAQGGLGVLLGGVPGVMPAQVVVIGGGVVGTQAAKMAVGLGANVTLLDNSLPRLRELDSEFNGRINCVFSTLDALEHFTACADLVVGAVLIPGAAAPKLLTREMLANMKKGSVVVDVAIDQGGCFETSVATTHESPTYEVDGIIHYCVANMPGAVARTATMALNIATLKYARLIASKGLDAFKEDVHLKRGLNICRGAVTHPEVAQALGYQYVDPSTLI